MCICNKIYVIFIVLNSFPFRIPDIQVYAFLSWFPNRIFLHLYVMLWISRGTSIWEISRAQRSGMVFLQLKL